MVCALTVRGKISSTITASIPLRKHIRNARTTVFCAMIEPPEKNIPRSEVHNFNPINFIILHRMVACQHLELSALSLFSSAIPSFCDEVRSVERQQLLLNGDVID